MNDVINDFKSHCQLIIEQLKEDLKSIRTGRANPSLVEDIIVEAYGGQTKLKIQELASLFTEGPSVISITPFDPSTTSDIERAIIKSPLGITPSNQGGKILISIPPLSQEQREKILKIVGQKVEEHRVMVRNNRDDARKKIKHKLEAKEISEDDKFRLEKEIDTINHTYMDDIQEIKEKKDKEILEV